MEKLGEIIALGGLFHDIGKVIQRAREGHGTHSKRGAEFLRNLARKTGIKEYEILALFSEFHHKAEMNEKEMEKAVEKVQPERLGLSKKELINAMWLVYEADNISSSEREEDSKLNIENPLKSIFTSVDIGMGEVESRYYPVIPLDFEHELPIPQKETVAHAKDYEFLKGRIEYELENLEEISVDKVLAVLEHYLTFVPAMTSKENDISLYDHVRMTSAIALALYHYHRDDLKEVDPEEFKKRLSTNEKKLLLIGADFSGIQDFIYTINMRGALKYLRARSTYLDLLSWDIVMEIIERLNLTRANVIYNGGGSFTILAQNTKEVKHELEKIRREISEWLYRKFNGKLYLAIGWTELSIEDLRNFKEGKLWEELKDRVNEKKNKRFEEILNEDFFIDKAGVVKRAECDVCRKQVTEKELEYIKEKDIHICKMCKHLWNLGNRLPKVEGFLRVKEKMTHSGEITHTIECPFSTFYTVEVPKSKDRRETKREEIRKTLEVLRDRLGFEGGTVFLKNSFDVSLIPANFDLIPYIVADYAKRVIEDENEHIITFEQLAKNSIGAKRVGVMRADVDNLGFVFAVGLKKHSKPTPSRIATLSRFLDYFFKGYLNQIAQGKFWYMVEEEAREHLPTLHTTLKENEKPNIVIVYAGGDDLFIVGSWNEIFNLAFRIRELFRKYVGENPNITLSAGIGFFDENYPLARMAEVTRERLEKAKDEGKNRITLLERFEINRERFKEFADTHKASYEWDHYKKLWNRYARSIYDEKKNELKEINGKKLSKSLLWKILQAQELYVRNPRGISWNYILAYYLGRSCVEQIFKELISIDVSKVKNYEPQEIYFVDGILKIVLFAIRG